MADRGSGIVHPGTSAQAPTGAAAAFVAHLLAHATLTLEEIEAASEYGARSGTPLVDAIVALGQLPEILAYSALAAALGMEFADLTVMAASETALRVVPERVARRHLVLPLAEDNRVLTYATAQPYDAEAERDVAFASGRRARALLAPRGQITAALERCYGQGLDIQQLLRRIRGETRVQTADPSAPAVDSPVVRLCDQILSKAVNARASDIHIEPSPAGATVRYRVHGMLDTVLQLPREAVQAVTNRFKVVARIDIGVRNRPQDGAFRTSVDGRAIDVRASTLPTVHGESVVMRIIDTASEVLTLDLLGHDPQVVAQVKRVLQRPDGLILVTGPTGSGKTTTLYAALHHLRRGDTSIVTVEDPVERRIDGVNQIHVNTKAGTSFATVLRSVLRQDPDVIMVGEIRDAEVAEIVGQAACTGHLVLSSLHTADAASAITRLLHLGLEPFKIAESLTAVVAQRLVRRLCPQCRIELDPFTSRARARQLGIRAVPFEHGPGCRNCGQTGYVDRLAVAEMLLPDDAMRTAITRGRSATEIRQAMRAAGQPTMRDAALEMVAEGITSAEEVNRVLADEAAAAHASAPAAAAGIPEPASPPPASAATIAAAPDAPQPAAPLPPGHQPRVLVTDDDRMTRLLVKLLLEKQGYEVVEAANGQEALSAVTDRAPDMLILDLYMPEVDGFETLQALQSTRARPATIVLTSSGNPGIEAKVFDLGADDYLQKPFEPDVLLARVRGVFRRAERIVA